MRGSKGLAMLAMLAALAALAGSLLGLDGVAGASGHHPSGTGPVYFRPVLCYAPPYSGGASGTQRLPFPTCSHSSLLGSANLQTTPSPNSPNGFTINNIAPYAALATVRSTTPARDKANATVLLPGMRGLSGPSGPNERYVLGPAALTSRAIASASATKNRTGQWVVDYDTTKDGAAQWDRVAEASFHQLLAVDLDGVVVSAPIIQPTQSSFTSFGGRGEISGNLTRAEAMRLAQALTSSSG